MVIFHILCTLTHGPFLKYLLVESEVRRPHHHQGCVLQLGVGLAGAGDRGPEPSTLHPSTVLCFRRAPPESYNQLISSTLHTWYYLGWLDIDR